VETDSVTSLERRKRQGIKEKEAHVLVNKRLSNREKRKKPKSIPDRKVGKGEKARQKETLSPNGRTTKPRGHAAATEKN